MLRKLGAWWQGLRTGHRIAIMAIVVPTVLVVIGWAVNNFSKEKEIRELKERIAYIEGILGIIKPVRSTDDLKQPLAYNERAKYEKITEEYELVDKALKKLNRKTGQNIKISLNAQIAYGSGLIRLERYREAEDVFRSVLATHPESTPAMKQLGVVLFELAKYDEAELLMRRALKIDEVSLGSDHLMVARDLNNLAVLLGEMYRLDEAEPMYRRALKIYETSFGPDHHEVARNLNNLALVLYRTKRFDEAERIFRRTLAIYETSFGPDHPKVALHLNNLAKLLQAMKRLDEAELMYRRAIKICEGPLGPDQFTLAGTLNNLAWLLKVTDRLDESESLCRRALKIYETSFGPDHPHVATVLHCLAGVLHETKRFDEAERIFRRTLAIYETSFGPDHPGIVASLNNLAILLEDTKRLDEAELMYRRALEILLEFARETGHEHRNLMGITENYWMLLSKMGYSEDQIKERLKEIAEPYISDVRLTWPLAG